MVKIIIFKLREKIYWLPFNPLIEQTKLDQVHSAINIPEAEF